LCPGSRGKRRRSNNGNAEDRRGLGAPDVLPQIRAGGVGLRLPHATFYRELRERAEEADREREIGPRLSGLAGQPPFPPDYTTIPAIATYRPDEYGIDPDELARPHRQRSRRDSDVRHAFVAWLYVKRVREGSRRAAEEVAEELGREYDAKKVTDTLFQARRKGLLTRTERGRARGELTEKARDILRREAQHQRQPHTK
jgi:hypothetical protein